MSGNLHVIRDGRFECLGTKDSVCHFYPACGCETWVVELHGQYSDGPNAVAAPGHESVAQESCWVGEWLIHVDLWDTYLFDADDGRGEQQASPSDTFPDGPVEYEFEGDWMSWHYADDTLPVSEHEAQA